MQYNIDDNGNMMDSANRLQKAVESLEGFVNNNKAVISAASDDERMSNLIAENEALKEKQSEAKQRLDNLITEVSGELNI